MPKVNTAPWWQGETWAMEQAALDALLASDAEALFGGGAREPSKGYEVRDGVAVISLKGVLANRTGFAALFGGASYTSFSAAISQADVDPSVRSIRIDVDSPGGLIAGAEAAAASLATASKATVAMVDGLCCSAAYWVASQADSIEATRTSRIGSIGVIRSVVDTRKRAADMGIVTHDFISSQSPNKRPDPATDDGAAQFQVDVDAMAAVFIEDVAAGRRVTASQVENSFGKGRALIASAALSAGLIDKVITTPARSRRGDIMPQGVTADDTAALAALTAKHSAIEVVHGPMMATLALMASALSLADTGDPVALSARVLKGIDSLNDKLSKASTSIAEAATSLAKANLKAHEAKRDAAVEKLCANGAWLDSKKGEALAAYDEQFGPSGGGYKAWDAHFEGLKAGSAVPLDGVEGHGESFESKGGQADASAAADKWCAAFREKHNCTYTDAFAAFAREQPDAATAALGA